jgi:glycosyltransferase involved in cell wall biosynthesis
MFQAADILLSASRYESYGLAIAEALCRGVPAVIPASAGIAASLSEEYGVLVIHGTPEARTMIDALQHWAAHQERWRTIAATEGARLRQYTTEDMAAAIVRVVEA